MFSPVTAGEAFQFTGPLELDNGQPLPNLTQVATAQFVFAPDDFAQPTVNTRFAATGAVAINASAATYAFTPSSLDLANLKSGVWQFQAVVTYTGGGQRYSKPLPLQVNPAL